MNKDGNKNSPFSFPALSLFLFVTRRKEEEKSKSMLEAVNQPVLII